MENPFKSLRPFIIDFTLRGFRGESDYPEIHRIIAGCKEVDQLEWSNTLADVTRNYAHLHHCDPNKDMFFAEINDIIVGYTRGWWDIDGDGNWLGFTLGYVLPAWRGKGIGRTLLGFIEKRLHEIADELINNGHIPAGTPRFYNAESYQTETAKQGLLLHTGYQPIRYGFEMVRPDLDNIPDAPLPPGLEVRPVLPDHYRLIWDASNEAFRDHWGYIPEPEEEFQKMLVSPTFDPSLWRVAWEGDQVAGMVLSFINTAENLEFKRKRGYTEGISVRRPWRRRGLARALICLSLHALKERGMQHAALGVDSQNISGALRVYEWCGFRVIKQDTFYRKPLE
jgi:mycothiol synthase